jgi:hypothetical protein
MRQLYGEPAFVYEMTDCKSVFWRLAGGSIFRLFLLSLLAGCAIPQVYSSSQHNSISLHPGDLETYGIAFITPATVTGQEEEKQTVALIFADVLKQERPQARCVTLPETLSAINEAGLADDYKRMFEDYRNTGIFPKDILRKIGEVTGTRYIAQLKLSGFSQGSNDRFSFFGFRLFHTQHARIRLFFQIWNSQNGTIAWEGVQELVRAEDTLTEEDVTLKRALDEAAHELIARLP